MYRNIKYIIINFFKGLKNLYYYREVIWNDKSFDYTFLYTYLKAKLKLDYEFYKNEGFTVSSDKVAEEILLAIKLCEKLEVEYYENEMFELDSNTFIEKYKGKYNRIKKRNPSLGDREIIGLISEYNNNQCKELFFKLLRYKINTWWD